MSLYRQILPAALIPICFTFLESFLFYFLGNTTQQQETFEKFHFTINKKKVFIGEKQPHVESTLVHNKVIPPHNKVILSFGKFKITTVLARRALGWTQYDPDVHWSAHTIWDLNDVKKTESHKLSIQILFGYQECSGAMAVDQQPHNCH